MPAMPTLLAAFLLFPETMAMAQQAGADPAPLRDLMADTWVATDDLGRTLPTHDEVGDLRPDKTVAIFYHTWHMAHSKTGPWDIDKTLRQFPNALADADHPAWGPRKHFHHWGEPLLGYYTSTDEWVYRRHARMLSAAGVDVVIFDATNQFSYQEQTMALCRAFAEVRAAGGPTPQIAFMTPFVSSAKVVNEIHEYLYKPGLYRDLWFMWDGKPLVLANPASISDQAQLDFFTFRFTQPDMFAGPTWPPHQGPPRPDMWSWLEVHPQHVYRDAAGNKEMMSVGIGQNAQGDRLCSFTEPGTRGRSWHRGAMDPRPNATAYGFNFQEQWNRALSENPELIYVTAWNEWTAMRLGDFYDVRLPNVFVDGFTPEYSRDAEPMRGGHGDNYYMQLAQNIRRFKGTRPLPAPAKPFTIDLAGSFNQWDSVSTEYQDYAGDTTARDAAGYGGGIRYLNTTGRNDIIAAKVAHDDHNVYFYVRTAHAITPGGAANWMMLFMNVSIGERRSGAPAEGRTPAKVDPGINTTAWHGYHFIVNRVAATGGEALLEANAGMLPGALDANGAPRDNQWVWRPTHRIPFRAEGNQMMLAIPRKGLMLQADAPFTIDFKWVDNFMAQPRADAIAAGQDPEAVKPDILDFYVSGDAAPTGRFNYRYRGL